MSDPKADAIIAKFPTAGPSPNDEIIPGLRVVDFVAAILGRLAKAEARLDALEAKP